jgi:uncharacterized protein (DUF4415 family)
MKPDTISKPFPTTPDEISYAIAQAPDRVNDPECAYDPNDPASVDAFWKEAKVRKPGQRGPGRKARKVLLSVRYSPEVVEYFKATGEGWQARMDEALKEWVASRRPA